MIYHDGLIAGICACLGNLKISVLEQHRRVPSYYTDISQRYTFEVLLVCCTFSDLPERRIQKVGSPHKFGALEYSKVIIPTYLPVLQASYI